MGEGGSISFGLDRSVRRFSERGREGVREEGRGVREGWRYLFD